MTSGVCQQRPSSIKTQESIPYKPLKTSTILFMPLETLLSLQYHCAETFVLKMPFSVRQAVTVMLKR
jgi:hypothetical protein